MSAEESVRPSDADLPTAVATLEEKVQALTLAVSALVEDQHGRKPPVVWTYDARFPTDAQNVYEAEYWDVNIKRWVGPKPMLELHPYLRRDRTYRITMSVVDFITPEARASFGVRVNGVPAKLELAGRGTYRALFTTDMDGEQSLVLHSDVAKSPHELTGAEDKRELSFSVANISIVEAK